MISAAPAVRAMRPVLAAALLFCTASAGAAKDVERPAPQRPAPGSSAGADGPRDLPSVLARRTFADGVRLEGEGELRGAADAFERAFDADPGLVHAAVNAGILLERLGEPGRARDLYERVLAARPAFGPAARDLARLAIRAGDLAAAERDARGRLARAPEAAGPRNALTDVLLAAGRLDEAEAEARRAMALDDRDAGARVNLATVFHRQGKNELARTVLESARLLDDGDPAVWNRLGLVELSLGDRAGALERFRTAAALAPDYAEARANLGALLADAEDFDAANVELEAAVRCAPWSAAAWLDLGNARRGARRLAAAEAAYRRALELDATLADAHYDLALLSLDGDRPGTATLARLEEALAQLDAYERMGGSDPKVREHRKVAARAIERERKRLAREGGNP